MALKSYLGTMFQSGRRVIQKRDGKMIQYKIVMDKERERKLANLIDKKNCKATKEACMCVEVLQRWIFGCSLWRWQELARLIGRICQKRTADGRWWF